MRCGTLRFGFGAVRCGTICDRVCAKGPYGIETDFEIRAQTANSEIFGNIQVFRLNCAEGILQCRRPLLNSRKTSLWLKRWCKCTRLNLPNRAQGNLRLIILAIIVPTDL